ncbi:MAG: polysaccharide biosynthesis/export family protein [Janthinobacterium lividum]
MQLSPPPGHAALHLRRVMTLVLSAALASCAPGSGTPFLGAAQPESYRLGVDDQVRIITYGEDQLSDDFRVNAAGDLAMPLLGNVHAAGLTTDQLSATIAGELVSRKLLQKPSVSAEIVAFRPIYVLGEVARPGQYPYQVGMTMLTVVAVAGGFTYRAVQDYAMVVRHDGTTTVDGRLRPGAAVRPGDVVSIYERHF